MKLKSLLFGTAAGLIAVTGAQAAEPLAPIAEPVDFVRICDAFGTGFFFIPGTDTCIKIGGYVRTGFHYTHNWGDPVVRADPGHFLFGPGVGVAGGRPFIPVRRASDRNFNEYTTRARGRVTIDTRTQTGIGMVRTFIDQWFTRDTNPVGTGAGATVSGVQNELRNAFIQIANDWGTVTLGKAPNFFEFWESDAWADRLGEDAPLNVTNLAAVTFNLGGGVSASLSLEDGQMHGTRVAGGSAFFPIDTNFDGIADAVAQCLGDGFPASGLGVGAFGTALCPTTLPGFGPVGAGLFGIHGGQRAPDVVANIRVDQAWGSAQVMAALHPIRARAFTGPPASPDSEPSTEWGWAVGAGAGVDIPGTGITFNIQGVYADGAVRYATEGGPGVLTDGVVVGTFNPLTAAVMPGALVGTDIETSEAWSIKAGIGGSLAPDWRFNLQGSFARVDMPDALGGPIGVDADGRVLFAAGPTAVQTRVFDPARGVFLAGPVVSSDYDFWTVSGNVAWAPVRGFIAGVELGYEKIDFDNGGDLDRWGGMVRVQQSF